MIKIKGKIKQIISPEEQHRYIIPFKRLNEFVVGQYLVVVEKDIIIPKGLLSYIWFRLTHGHDDLYYDVIMLHCNCKVGDIIETIIKPIMVKSGFYINEV